MAVRRESRSEKQSSEVTERPAIQNQINPKTGRQENVDSMVSRFLAELTDLSSEMGQAGSKFKLEEQVLSKSDPDLERIDEEIEKSLSELENLEHGSAPKQDQPLPDAQAKQEPPPVQTRIQKAVEPARIESPGDPEEQAWTRLEVFRNSVSTRKDRSLRTRVWAGVGLVVILGIVGIYLFRSDTGEPKAVDQAAVPEPPLQTTKAAEKSEKAIPTIDLRKESKPIDSGRSLQERPRSKPTPRSTSRTAEKSSNRRYGSSAAGVETRRAERVRNSDTAVRQRTNEESVRPAPAQAVNPVPPPEQAVLAPPPAAVAQPKSNPVLPAGSTASPPAAGATAPTREMSPPAPKPVTTPAVPENVETGQPKIATRTPVMAEVVKKVPPEYPMLARVQKVTGRVDVEAEIDEKGDVVRAKAISGPNALRLSAEEALKKWKFKPASVDGVNVPSKARVSVNFNLQ